MPEPEATPVDPRVLTLPPAVLEELGMDLRPFSRRWFAGGCPRCRAIVRLTPPDRGSGWRRYVRHERGCLVPAYRGRVPGAWMN